MHMLNVECNKAVHTIQSQETRRMLSKARHVKEHEVGSRGSG